MAPANGLAVALLAAGRSTRFGASDKLTALLGGRPLIDWAAQAGRSVAAASHVVVASPDSGFGADALGYRLLPNPRPEQGMASSLRIAATAATEAGASALLVLLADVPFVAANHLLRLVETFRADESRPVFSIAPGGVAQPPALFSASFFPALCALDGDKGARGLASGAALVETDPDNLLDIDTPDDLARAEGLIARVPGSQP